MAKRSGLGRGLDGMFTSYLNTEGKNTKTTDNGTESRKTAGKAEEKAVKPEKSGKGSGKSSKEKENSSASAAVKNDHSAEKEAKKGTVQKGSSQKKVVSEEKESGQVKAAAPEKKSSEDGVIMLKISQVEPNREQPRKDFQEEGLNELAASIRQYGIIQPLVVQKRDDYYEIIAGERRWRAARIAGVKEVPVVIKDYSEQEIVEVSLIENIQREDLNPIEEALAYQRLLDEFSLRQEDVARRVSKNRTTITNSLRLLKLDDRIREYLIDGRLTSGHARALLGIENKELQFEVANRILSENLSVRDVEKLVKSIQRGNTGRKKEPKKDTATDLVCSSMEEKMKASLGTKVRVNRRNNKAGRIEIEYYSMEELERIYDLICSMGGDRG